MTNGRSIKRKRRTFSREHNLAAITKLIEQGLSYSEVARSGIGDTLIHHWRDSFHRWILVWIVQTSIPILGLRKIDRYFRFAVPNFAQPLELHCPMVRKLFRKQLEYANYLKSLVWFSRQGEISDSEKIQ